MVVCPNPCPKLVILGLRTYCRCCRHVTKIINNNSKDEQILKLTVHLQLLQYYFSPAKIYIFVNDEVRAGCSKLGHTTL